MKLRLFKLWYQNWFRGTSPSPPYKHIVQLGDPVLRQKAQTVEKDLIKSDFMMRLLNRLYYLMDVTGASGLSAPQIGVSLRVFAIQSPEKNKFSDPNLYDKRGMKSIPFQVWVNPEMKVLDYSKVLNEEGCESMCGFSAEVPRYKKVLLTGLDEHGQTKRLEADNWSSRIIQHEMDHLNGQFYTDIMLPKSLVCSHWNAINFYQGRIYTTYMPKR